MTSKSNAKLANGGHPILNPKISQDDRKYGAERAQISGAKCILATAIGFVLLTGSGGAAYAAARQDSNGIKPGKLAACRSAKLKAVGDYYECLLLRNGKNIALHGGCDKRFMNKFAKADKLSPGCPPLDDPDRTQRYVLNQARAVHSGDPSVPPCQEITSDSSGKVTCWLHKPGENTTTSWANLDDILAQLTSQSSAACAPCQNITSQTPMWMQAWGGKGGKSGGNSGFAQTVTTLADLQNQGIVTLFFYLGRNGYSSGTTGGSGGAATLVTQEDLQENPATAPVDALLIAGGGGGGGGQDTGCLVGDPTPHGGASGGVAISQTGPDGEGIGQGNDATNGKGGGQGVAGSGHSSGSKGIGGQGGKGGQGAGHSATSTTAWFNTGATQLTITSGKGGDGGDDSSSCTTGGGGGGGGWGGGGSGSHGNADTKAGGGGGGGSYSIPSKCADPGAPTTYVSNPDSGAGTFQIVFNTEGSCTN